MTSLLRQLCGELEDMCVWEDTVGIMAVRERLEPAVADMEAALRAALEHVKWLLDRYDPEGKLHEDARALLDASDNKEPA